MVRAAWRTTEKPRGLPSPPPVLTLLHRNTEGGIGGKELPAPQAGLFASLAEGFSGQRELPWTMIGIGAVLGLAILIIDTVLQASDSKYRAHLMPIAVGMYLPFGLATPILIGGLIAYRYTRGVAKPDHDRVLHRGVLFSSGVIAGEALTAVGIAGLAACGISAYQPDLTPTMLLTISLGVAMAILGAFLWFARPHEPS